MTSSNAVFWGIWMWVASAAALFVVLSIMMSTCDAIEAHRRREAAKHVPVDEKGLVQFACFEKPCEAYTRDAIIAVAPFTSARVVHRYSRDTTVLILGGPHQGKLANVENKDLREIDPTNVR